jgi:hypothetical protein
MTKTEAETQVGMFECEIEARPLGHSLREYHEAVGGNENGGLGYTWSDKPHRLLYDLIAAVKYYADLAQTKQPAQEPVATVQCIHGVTIGYLDVMQPVGTKLYTSPNVAEPRSKREWVGLTFDEKYDLAHHGTDPYEVVMDVEAKLREKND